MAEPDTAGRCNILDKMLHGRQGAPQANASGVKEQGGFGYVTTDSEHGGIPDAGGRY